MKRYSVYTLALLAAVLMLAVSHTDAQVSASELAGLKAIRDAFPSLNASSSSSSWTDTNLENICSNGNFQPPTGITCVQVNGAWRPEKLVLYANQTAAIDESALAGLVSLKSLTLNLDFSTAFKNFTSFTVLNLTSFEYHCSNAFCALDSSVVRWTSLTNLAISSVNGFTSFPESLAPLTKLTSLTIFASSAIMPGTGGVNFQSSMLSEVSSLTFLSVISYNFPWTTVLDFSANKNLETLVLSSDIASLPDVFTGFTRLARLDVGGNYRLSKLPDSLSSCVSLARIIATDCNMSLANSFFDMSNLSNLVSVYADNNKMRSIPTSLCNLPTSLNGSNPSLTLNLETNPIASVAPCFGSNTKLTALALSGTKMTSFPTPFLSLSGLTRLFWNNNDFQMNANVDFSSLSKLSYLDITNIKLVGAFPNSVSSLNLMSTFAAPRNTLKGTISNNFFQRLTQLRYFDIAGSEVTGAFPTSINAPGTVMTTLSVARNRFTTLPDAVQNLSKLEYIDFSDNQLTVIPSATAWKSLRSLRTIALGGNVQLNGPLPSFWAQSADFPSLETVNMSSTGYTGDFPSLNTSSLNYAYFYDMALSGSILGITRATNLQHLRLERNVLTGTLPSSLSLAAKMTRFDVSNNMLSGTVPSSFSSITTLTYIALNNNGFTGALPDIDAMRVSTFQVQNNQFDLCAQNPRVPSRASGNCNVTNNAFPNACRCPTYYSANCAVQTTCPPPDFVPSASTPAPFVIPTPVKAPTAPIAPVPVFSPSETATPGQSAPPSALTPSSTPRTPYLDADDEPMVPTGAAHMTQLAVSMLVCAAIAAAIFM